jgi:hypothetical protein
MNTSDENALTGMIGARPNRPPMSTYVADVTTRTE